MIMPTVSASTCLVVPASSERMLVKARTIEAGEIVLDLEDAVIPERKPEALRAALAALTAGEFSAPNVFVRINPPDSEWIHDELAAFGAAPGALTGVVVPKVESAADLGLVERLLARSRPLKIHALIETAKGLRDLAEITGAPDRLEALVLGYVDLAASLGRTSTGADDLDLWLPIQQTFLTAARAAGIRAIDGPHTAIDDVATLSAAARRAADLGFDAKWAIHPQQLEPIASAFAPSAAEIARARAVLDALAAAQETGDGAVKLNGEMVDEPVRLAALRTLARVPGALRS
jgi:citrate lyase subunit beta/citryl-CoA lyase